MSIWRRITTHSIVFRTLRHELTSKSVHNCMHKNVNITSTLVNRKPDNLMYSAIRFKTKKQNQNDSDDESDVFDDDSSLSKDSKLVKFSTTSMRTDMVLKSALNISRNKVEQMFYESKIRINGKKILKKSAAVRVGDEIDVFKMVSPKNPDHLYVSRVEVLNVAPKEDSIIVTTRRFKHLLIENYEKDAHQSVTESEA